MIDPTTPDRAPFDDLRELIDGVPEGDTAMAEATQEVLAGFPGPKPALGRYGDLAINLSRWQRRSPPRAERPLVAVFAGTHDVVDAMVEDGVVKASQSRVIGLTQGSAAVRGIARGSGAAFKVYEFGLELPAEDFTKTASLSERDCAAAFAFGMEVVAEGADIIVLGSAGCGAATAAAGIARGLYGGTAEYWADSHTEHAAARIARVEAGAALHAGSLDDPLEVLRRFGGRDIAGFAGAIIAARYQAIPVVLDGFVTCAAAAVLHGVNPTSVAHCVAAHRSAEPAHAALLERLDLADPVLEAGIGVGDGTGGAIALTTITSVCAAVESLAVGDIAAPTGATLN